jgi:hypothetical protein
MKFFPVGERPREVPEWFRKEMERVGMPAGIPLWFLGDQEDLSVPAALYLEMPPGYTLFRHGHPCERFEIVIQGSLDVGDGRIAKPGDVFTAKPGELYGPHTTGPDGATTIEVFGHLDGMFRLLYEDDNGTVVEIDARKGQVAPDYVPIPSLDAPARDPKR